MAKTMDLLMRLQAKIDKRLPSSLQNLAKDTNRLSGATKELSLKLKESKKAEKLYNGYEKTRNDLSKNLIQLRKYRNELRKLDFIKKSGNELSKIQERKYKRLATETKKLTRTTDKQRVSFQKYKIGVKKLKKPLRDYQKEISETTKKLKKLNLVQKLGAGAKRAGNIGGRVASGALKWGKRGLVAGTIAAGALGVKSAGTYLDFNKNMKKVQAIAGATKEEFNSLEKKAMELGATTKFTASESASAMEKMALAGFDTNQILKATPGVLDLAAASGEDVAMVSDIITDNLIAFKMQAKDTGRFADVLAWGMSKTNVNIEMLGESFKFASANASNLGVSLEETVGTLGLMGDQAVKSGMAGRGMDAIFSKLAGQSGKLKRMGIDVKNADGSFVGIVDTVKQFEDQMQGMGDVEKVDFLQNIFGKQGGRAFSKLLSAQKKINGITYKGSEAVAKTIESATKNSVGMASKMKNTMLEGASGTVTLLSSAFDGLKNAIGKKLFSENSLPYIKTLTSYISELANVMNGTFSDNKYNRFWKGMFEWTSGYIEKVKRAIEPAVATIQKLISKEEMKAVFIFVSDLFLKIVGIISKIIQLATPFLRLGKTIIVFTFKLISKIYGFIDWILEKITNIKMPGWVSNIFNKMPKNSGENFGMEVDGSHRNGLDYVPFDGYVAELHKGERVLTSEENKNYKFINKKVSKENISLLDNKMSNSYINNSYKNKNISRLDENEKYKDINTNISKENISLLDNKMSNSYINNSYKNKNISRLDEEDALDEEAVESGSILEELLKVKKEKIKRMATDKKDLINYSPNYTFTITSSNPEDIMEKIQQKLKESEERIKRLLEEGGNDRVRTSY